MGYSISQDHYDAYALLAGLKEEEVCVASVRVSLGKNTYIGLCISCTICVLKYKFVYCGLM